MAGFVQGMVKVGDPADPTVMLGPVIREERRTKIEEYIESGKNRGRDLATGGKRPKDLSKGWFLEPTIFCQRAEHHRIAREEIFGPVVSVIPFKRRRRGDPHRQRLHLRPRRRASTRSDTGKALELAKRIRTGVVWINNGLNCP